MSEIKKCEHCEDRTAKELYLGSWLCTECKAECKEAEAAREDEEAEELRKKIEGTWTRKPSIISDLYINAVRKGLKLSLITSQEKCEDFSDTNIRPLLHRMSDSELEGFAKLQNEWYFALKTELSMRKTTREQEAETIKRSRKAEKTTAKSTKEIEKQKKFASKDKTLSKEDRLKARLIESLIALGMSEEKAREQAEKVKK